MFYLSFFYFDKHFTHFEFPIYLVVIRDAHSVNKLWQWCVFDEDVSLWLFQQQTQSIMFCWAQLDRLNAQYHALVHIPTNIHTYIHTHTIHNMIFFFQNRNMDYLNIFFSLHLTEFRNVTIHLKQWYLNIISTENLSRCVQNISRLVLLSFRLNMIKWRNNT